MVIRTVEKARVFLIYCPSKFIAINEFKKEIIKAIIDGRIRVLVYQKNKSVSDEQIRVFRDIFSPVANYFAECDNSVRELGVMSQVYAHLVSYYDVLVNQGSNPETLRAYFDLTCKSLESPKGKVRTKQGLTDALFDFEVSNLPDFVNSEKEVLEERLQWIQTE